MARTFDDGSSQYCQHGAAVLSGPPISVAARVRSNDDTAGQTVFGIGDASTDTDFYRLLLAGHVGSDPVRWVNRAGGSNATASTTSGFTANTWHLVGAVEAAANSRFIYIDGGSVGTDTTNQTPSNLDITTISKIARLSSGGHFSGDIGLVVVWNVVITAAEWAAMAAGDLHPLNVRPESIVAFWYDDRRGRTDNDLWGNYDMTAYATPTWTDDPPGLQYPQGIVQTDWAQSILQGV
tara:strand:+ start:721 stop:1431 length:711 start_codon:yes stop_codon:yes gene_type:complete